MRADPNTGREKGTEEGLGLGGIIPRREGGRDGGREGVREGGREGGRLRVEERERKERGTNREMVIGTLRRGRAESRKRDGGKEREPQRGSERDTRTRRDSDSERE